MNELRTAFIILCITTSGLSVLSAQQHPPTRVRVPSSEAAGMTSKVVLPRDIGIPGDVVLEVLVSRAGVVRSVRRVSGDERLQQVAIPAVMKWQFKAKNYLHGQTVEFLTEVGIHFDGNKGGTYLYHPDKQMAIPPPPLPDVPSPKPR